MCYYAACVYDRPYACDRRQKFVYVPCPRSFRIGRCNRLSMSRHREHLPRPSVCAWVCRALTWCTLTTIFARKVYDTSRPYLHRRAIAHAYMKRKESGVETAQIECCAWHAHKTLYSHLQAYKKAYTSAQIRAKHTNTHTHTHTHTGFCSSAVSSDCRYAML